MATFWNGVPHVAETSTSPRIFGRVLRVFAWIAERRAQAATMRELQRMDERDLHDLRISPYDFNEIANGTFRR
jgi:uncharacterized protein YjiS (DUF1127 family)